MGSNPSVGTKLFKLSWRNWQTHAVEYREMRVRVSPAAPFARVVQLAGDGSFKNCTVQGSNPAASTSLIVQTEGKRAYPNR